MNCYLRSFLCCGQRFVFPVLVGTCFAACASRPDIVADPPQHTHKLPEAVPWEEDYARMRPNPEIFEAGESSGGAQFNGDLEGRPEDRSGTLQVLADVIAFPFRGVGWLLRQVF